MNTIDLQKLASIIGTSGGYLSVNKSNNLEVKGSSFFGRLVYWVQFKLSKNYREADLIAKRKVVASLLCSAKYGEDFQQKINNVDPQGKFFYASKPLSARAVSVFINAVKEDSRLRKTQRATDWVNWFSGKVGLESSNESFVRRAGDLLEEKIKSVPHLEIDDINLTGVRNEVNKEALKDPSMIEDITNPNQAEALVDRALSVVLDERIAAADLQLQNRLRERLEDSGLADTAKQTVATEITDQTITTTKQLTVRVNELLVKQIGDEFDDVYKQARESTGFNENLKGLPEVKEQLQLQLARQNQHGMLSIETARRQAVQLLSQWIRGKQDALATIQSSPFAGVHALLSKLVLNDPYVSKARIQSIQQNFDLTMEEVYAKNSTFYEALGMDKGRILSKLHQYDRRDVLFNRLSELLKRAPKPASLFDDNPRPVAGIKKILREYMHTTSKPIIETHKKVSALKKHIPERIYRTLVDKVNGGALWGTEFKGVANQLYIDTLTANGNQGLYRLLASPQVAQKAIGSKENLEGFTLDELLVKVSGTKDINNPDDRRSVIDRVISEQFRTNLVDELERQLGMVKSRVMSEADVDGVFQRGTLRFLRELKMNFEEMRPGIDSGSDAPPIRIETPI